MRAQSSCKNAGKSKHEVQRAVSAARARWRSDIDQASKAEADVLEAAEYLEHASHLALSSLLLVSGHTPVHLRQLET